MSLALLLLSLVSAINAIAASPPPVWVDSNSPLALNLHPRLFLISDSYKASHPNAYGISLSEMRSRLNTDYPTEFQRFIDVMDAEFSKTAAFKGRRDMVNDGTNFAFLHLIDPTVMSQAPYGFTFTHTKAEYGSKAKEHLLAIANNVIGFTGLPYSGGWADVVHLVERGHINASMSMIYDWIYPVLSLSDKQTTADAFIDAYNNRVSTFGTYSFPHTNNGTISIMQNGTLGALAMWGDNIDNSGSTYYAGNMDTLLGAVKSDWIERVFGWLNYVGEGSSNWAEGPLYDSASFGNFSRIFGLMGTSLNYDYYSNSTYFVDKALWTLFNIHPSKNDQNQTTWYHFEDDDPDKYFLGCKSCYSALSPFFNATGTLNQTHPDSASLAKWIKDDSGYTLSSNISSASSDVRYYSLLYHFLWGDKAAQSKSPAQLNIPLSKKLGGGQFVLRSGFGNTSDSHVVFWAPKYFEQQSHAHIDFASFTIAKHGNLALQRSIAKTFSGGNLHATARSMFYNTIGVYKPGETHYGSYNLMGYRTSYDASATYKTDAAYQPGGANHVGNVTAYDLEANSYDYINYDYSRAWDGAKVDYANRQFVYLRSQGGTDDEYVVILDRVNAVDPNYTKYFLLHSAFTPTLTADSVEITNAWTGNGSHGKLFNKILLPTSYQINQVTDWQDADGTLIHSAATLTDAEKNYRGSHTTQIQATTHQNHDTFLNVLQFGDAGTLNSMSGITRIDGDTMVGAAIDDPTAPRVALFSSDPRGAAVSSVTYAVTLNPALTGKHLLLDMSPGSYDVYRNGTPVFNGISASSEGALTFDALGGATYQVVKVGQVPNQPPTVSLSTDKTSGNIPLTVNFTANASDSDGYIATIEWDFEGNGHYVTAPANAQFTYSQAGSFTAAVRVTDDGGLTESDSLVITATAPPDLSPPTVPANLQATASANSQIDLTWAASTDNVAVTGYEIYRDGALIGTSHLNSYSDTGLTPATPYLYTVRAYDAAANTSGDSAAAWAATLGGSPVIDIRANGSNGPITINSGEPLQISIAMAAGSLTGQAADWWIVIKTPSGFIPYYFPLPLFDLAPLTLLDNAGLPAGNYTFFFAADDNQDGRFDGHHLDFVDVTIR